MSWSSKSESEIDELFIGATFGMEFDCGAFDRNIVLDPKLGTYCAEEIASHTNKGIGADPQIIYNRFGGEVQVTPANSEAELFKRITVILGTCLATRKIEHASTIHMHVRVPGLLRSPATLRYLVRWSTAVWPAFADEIYQWQDLNADNFSGWWERYNRFIKHATYDKHAIHRMESQGSTPAEIALSLHDHPAHWKTDWRMESSAEVVRPAVNFGHLAINETIEFRIFTATTNESLLKNIIAFPLRFLRMGLAADPDPVRIIRGVRFQDTFQQASLEHCELTNRYYNNPVDIRGYIAKKLINGELTLADLNYPKFWVDKGFG